MTSTEKQAAAGGYSLPDFTVEFGDPLNRQIYLSTLEKRVRGHFSISKIVARSGPRMPNGGRVNIGDEIGAMPEIPGQRLRVDARDAKALKVIIFDPLETEEELRKKIARVLSNARRANASGSDTVGFIESQVQVVDADKFKTLLLELVQLETEKSLKVFKGKLPTLPEVEALPGRKLFDIANKSPHKPKYEDQVSGWYDALQRAFLAQASGAGAVAGVG